MPQGALPPGSRPLQWLVALAFFMETLDATVVNTALPAMARALGASPLAMQSVVVSYALTLAALIPISGWAADRFGTRRVYLAATSLFTVGSLACALSGSLTQLVAARVLQGVGGSMLLPVGRLAILRAFPGPGYIDALAFVSMAALIGPLAGPPVGGYLVQYASWHWIFLINLPIGLVGFCAIWRFMPEDRRANVGPFDWLGFLQVVAFMVSVSLGLDGLADLRLPLGLSLCLLCFGLAALSAYVLHARRAQRPLFSLRLFRSTSFSVGILGNFFARMGSSSVPFVMPLFLQLCMGYGPALAGLSMVPVAGASMLAKPIAARVILRAGYRRFLTVNTTLVGLAIASFSLLGRGTPFILQVAMLLVFGVINSMQFTAMNTLTLRDLTPAQAGAGNSLYSMVQMLAMSLAVAAAGALLAAVAHTAQDRRTAFSVTFACMGAMTVSSAWIFAQLADPRRGKPRPGTRPT